MLVLVLVRNTAASHLAMLRQRQGQAVERRRPVWPYDGRGDGDTASWTPLQSRLLQCPSPLLGTTDSTRLHGIGHIHPNLCRVVNISPRPHQVAGTNGRIRVAQRLASRAPRKKETRHFFPPKGHQAALRSKGTLLFDFTWQS